MRIEAQPGAQSDFLASSADIVIYGGAAGGGKTFALLLEPLRHLENPNFGAVIFRKNLTHVTNEGGLWHEAGKIYPLLDARPRLAPKLEWVFPQGSRVAFAHLQTDKDVYNWQGAQIPLICFDELTHFSASQFWYMLSRNRSTCGVKPYIRATTNPDSQSWVSELISWWIDPDSGRAIPERSGVIRYFSRLNNDLIWGDTAKEISDLTGIAEESIKSFTFIPATIQDNKILLTQNPEYLANLQALTNVERERLLHGNWRINFDGGIIRYEWLRRYTELPDRFDYVVQSWDIASASEDLKRDELSYTAGLSAGIIGKEIYLFSMQRFRADYPETRRKFLADNASVCPNFCLIEDAANAKALIPDVKAQVKGHLVKINPRLLGHKSSPNAKVDRLQAVGLLFESGRVYIPDKAAWVRDYISEITSAPFCAHWDQCDVTSQLLWFVLEREKLNTRRSPKIN